MITIELHKYGRRTLSDLLQMASQCSNESMPLPCFFVEQVVEAHDFLLEKELVQAKPDKTIAIQSAERVKRKEMRRRPHPPCVGCTVAVWKRFPCGSFGYECQGKSDGKCRMSPHYKMEKAVEANE